MLKIFFLLNLLLFTSFSNAQLIETKDPKALCSNGEQATFTFFEGNTNNWLMYIQGGGVAANEDQYRSRNNGLKSPAVSNVRGKTYMVEDFINNNYNVIYIPYCSNDIHQGTHVNNIDGKKVYFHGRYIIEDIFNQYDENFKKADKLIFAGYSAGSLALGLNVDLIKRYENPYIIADSFWLDAESLNVRLGWNEGPWPKIVKFLYNDRVEHCKDSHWANCFSSRPLFERNNLNNVFFIWNIGDPYMKGNLDKVKQSINEDSLFYNAGFSINAEERKLKGNIEWGHVMTATDLYYKDFDGTSLQKLIWNWINGSGETIYINN
ncbi:pectinacetylesterase family protein [Alphaproteobacteria bacterium]|nr:pectinacetylesterase family protein [Alphaproteobacteria bacterium]